MEQQRIYVAKQTSAVQADISIQIRFLHSYATLSLSPRTRIKATAGESQGDLHMATGWGFLFVKLGTLFQKAHHLSALRNW